MVKSTFEIAAPGGDDDNDENDEYWDDEDEAGEEGQFDGTNGRGHSNGLAVATIGSSPSKMKRHKKARMNRMKVATQRDYTAELAMMNPKARGVCCIGIMMCLVVVIAVIAIIPHSGGSGSARGSGSGSESDESTCIVHSSDEPFSQWTHHIRKTDGNELCRSEISFDDCKCINPFTISVDNAPDGWQGVFNGHLENLNKTLEAGDRYDLVLYGDSIIERMNGMVFGKELSELKDQLDVTTELLTRKGGGKIDALPLGIAGDEVHTLMYRLSNGEMQKGLKPMAWWLMIGTNDVVKADCDVDAVVAGIVTVANEIYRKDRMNRRDEFAHVIINSLFPRVNLDEDPLWPIIQTINSRLECYAETTEGTEFFNATAIFVKRGAVDPNLFLEDGIHLSVEGTKLWEEAIVKKALEVISHKHS